MKHFKLRWILFTALATILCWGWAHFRGLPFGAVSPWAALPADVPAMLEYPDFQAAFSSDSNSLVADFAIVASLEEDSRLLGRVLKIWSPQLKQAPLTVGLHPVGSGKISFSLLLDMRGHAPDVEQLMRSPEIRRVIPSVYRGHKIYTVYLHQQEAVFAFALYRNLLIVAGLPLLVEEAIGRLDWRPGSMARQSDFNGIRGPRQQTPATTRLYLQTGQLHQLLAGMVHPAGITEIQRWKLISTWLRLDLRRNKQQLLLSGLSGIPPQAPMHEALLERAQILQPKHLEVIPDNLALLWVGSIANWGRMSDDGGREFKKYISSWAGRELAIAMAQPKGIDLPSDWYAAIAVRQKDLAESRLSELADKAGTLQDYDYQSFRIRQVMTDQLLPFFPERRMENPFFAFVGEDVVFASSQAGLEVWIDAFIAGKTLARDERFLPLYEQGKQPGAWFLYLPADQLLPLLKAYAPQAPGIARFLQNLGDIAIAASAKGQHWQLKGTAAPSKASEAQSAVAWKALLPAPALSAPFPVVDSSARQICIAVQDTAFRLHLIGPAGELRWSKTLDGPLLSTVQTMDYYGDGSTALLFNTARNVYLTDMQGKELGNFPLPLQSPATNGVTVVNFDEGMQICFFIACANGNVYGFDRLGRPLPGWNPLTGAGTLRFPLLHFYKEDKDYLLTLNDKGVLRAYRRDGGERLPPRSLEGMFLSQPAYQLSEKSNRIVAMNAAGTVHVTGLKGEYFKLACLVGTGQGARLAFGAFTGDERHDYAVMSGEELALYAYRDNSKFEQVFSHRFDAPLDEVFCVRFPGEDSDRIGAVSRSIGKIYLMDAAGKLYPGFPLAGHAPFFVADLYQNGRPMVLSVYGDSVYAYQVGR